MLGGFWIIQHRLGPLIHPVAVVIPDHQSAQASRHSSLSRPPLFIIPVVFIQAGGLHGDAKIFSSLPASRIASRIIGLRACLKTGEWRDAGPRIPGRQEPAGLQ